MSDQDIIIDQVVAGVEMLVFLAFLMVVAVCWVATP